MLWITPLKYNIMLHTVLHIFFSIRLLLWKPSTLKFVPPQLGATSIVIRAKLWWWSLSMLVSASCRPSSTSINCSTKLMSTINKETKTVVLYLLVARPYLVLFLSPMPPPSSTLSDLQSPFIFDSSFSHCSSPWSEEKEEISPPNYQHESLMSIVVSRPITLISRCPWKQVP